MGGGIPGDCVWLAGGDLLVETGLFDRVATGFTNLPSMSVCCTNQSGRLKTYWSGVCASYGQSRRKDGQKLGQHCVDGMERSELRLLRFESTAKE